MNDLNTTDKTRDQLSALATHFAGQRETLLNRWRTETAKVSELSFSLSLTHLQFDDHIPSILDIFAEKLRAWPNQTSDRAQREEKEQVAEHGLQRWQQGYKLRDLTCEWGHLQRVLMEELESYSTAHPELELDVMPTARRALSHLCWDGIADSTTQYFRLHQTEAASRVRDLEGALSTLNELERARAEAWREAAHDLRGSVTVVKGAASMLEQEMPEPTRVQFFELLKRGVASLHEMLNDLMSQARLEAGQETRSVALFDAGVLLADFCTSSLPLAHARDLYLKMDGPKTLMVEGDRAKVQRILQNLLLNAFKYTQRGGVTVSWSAGQDRNSRDWTFSVQDTGPGLDVGPGAPLARQLFEATQTTHKVNEGASQNSKAGHTTNPETASAQSETLPPGELPGEGVGLSIVKRLCELLDAALELETSRGQGSTLRVTLPRSYDKSQ